LGIPFAASVFTSITWAIVDNISWIPVPSIPWAFLYIIVLLMHKSFFKRSKYTLLILFLMIALFAYSFAVMASACAFRFLHYPGLIMQTAILLIIVTFICGNSYSYYGKVWASNKFHNENVVLDQENGRYDFLNNFNMDESELKKQSGKQYSNAALTSLICMVSPVGVGISLIFAKGNDYTIPLIIVWILSVPVSLGFAKIIMGIFYNYRKLAYFEKKLGKPIINGLLD
jgi:hypothetical protein